MRNRMQYEPALFLGALLVAFLALVGSLRLRGLDAERHTSLEPSSPGARQPHFVRWPFAPATLPLPAGSVASGLPKLAIPLNNSNPERNTRRICMMKSGTLHVDH